MKEKENNLKTEEVDYSKRSAELSENIKRNKEDKEEIEKKKQIILDALNKL